ncbi:DUF1707 domain-containing protein [Jiangella sp. DSM 45060]|uniref:DUF1707 SHOCT-like domain-containing protein n=1 Tax=Jiangella sp. DSM 45060 TaxID=1798224 RepID=UPI00087D3BC3|nr:DUF1707 domain-containing protein [Jiangella sp. DSM 45060]SDR98551.1 protein of unknown function [Jiangella sp. DSM 45060]
MARGQNRRPEDDDRRRYTAVLDAARADGRIDDAELSRRSFTVRYAQTMGELDAVVGDLPGPDRTAGGRSLVTVAVAGFALLAAVGLGIVAASSGGDDEPAADPPAAVEAEPPPVEQAEAPPVDMFSAAELTSLWEALAAQQVSGVQSIYLHSDWADLEVRTAPGAPTYDDLEYDGALSEPTPGGEVNEENPDDVFFALEDVNPAVVAACAAQAAEIAQRPDRAVELVVIRRDVFYGDTVTINVHLESDAYGGSAVLTWDASGQHLLDDGTDP